MHLAHVEGLRAIAALVVYLNHAYAQVWEREGSSPPAGLLAPMSYSMVAGHLSVAVFIVISGFCLTLPVVKNGDQLRGGLRAFLKRRAWRILPPYYAAVALCLLLIWTIIGKPTGTLWDVPIQLNATAYISHLLLLQDLFGTSRINYVFWSIAVEWQIYFLFPILLWSFRRHGPAVMVGVALVVGYALRLGFADTRIARTSCHFIGLFALGMVAAYIACSPREPYPRLRSSRAWGFAAALTFIGALSLLPLGTGYFPLLDGVVGIMTATLLVHSSSSTGSVATRALSWRPLVFVGTFSYSVYLIHAPLLQILWQYALEPLGLRQEAMFVTLISVGLVCILAAAYLFFRLFEAPFMVTRTAARAADAPPAVPA